MHTAGIAGDLPSLEATDCEQLEKILQAKLYGTLVLEELLRNQFLDFFVMCSSLSSDMGGVGYGAYAVANAFMDAFSILQRQIGKKFISIKWGGWAEVGIGMKIASDSHRSGLTLLKNKDGIFAYDTILKYNLDNVWVCILNQKIREVYGNFSFFKFRNVSNLSDNYKESAVSSDVIQDHLFEMLQDVYSGGDLDVEEYINELDFDSIDIMQFVGKVKKAYDVEVAMKLFFEPGTVKEILDQIEGLVKGSQGENIIPVQPIQEYYPASSAQKRLLIINRFDQTATNYNITSALKMEGELDKSCFERAIKGLIKRHEAFRTSFILVDGEPVQKIEQDLDFNIEYLEAEENELENIFREFCTSFDLSQAPLLKVGLVKYANKYLFMFNLHHIISDGVSMSVFISEFAKLYNNENLKEMRIQYKDFAVWQNEFLTSEQIKTHETYWLDTFAGEVRENVIPVLNLPTDFPRPSEMDYKGGTVGFTLSKELTLQMKELAAIQGVTTYMILLAALNILFSKYTGQEEIIIGSPITGRRHADLENVIGIFVNTLAMKNEPIAEKTFVQFLAEVKENALNAFEHQDYQFEMLVEKLNLERDLSHNALFDVMFVLQNAGDFEVDIDNLKITPYEFERKTVQFDLSIEGFELHNQLAFKFYYITQLFKRETIERMTGHFVNILNQIIKNSKCNIAELLMISDAEREQLMHKFNETTVEYPKEITISQLFEEQVLKTPDNSAVVFEDQKLTYQELNEKANQIAKVLRDKGVGSDQIVAIMVDQSQEMIIGIMGILKAGGAYLPIDSEHPADRVEYMLNDSQVKILLTQYYLTDKIKFTGEIINIDIEKIDTIEDNNLTIINTANDLAYVIYTSGSTGKPKGVMVEHKSLVNLAIWYNDYYAVTSDDNTTKYAGFGFDASVWEIFPYLINGATIHIIGNEIRLDINKLNEYYERNKITISFLPTQICEQFMEVDNNSLRCLLTGGDKLKNYRKQSYQLVNNYGPT
ncbi:MAG: AMP-binding protein, partial [Halanaerobiales bacterium]|nr:AMP-binding protein [Halanaerobiales bacterium]